MRELKPFYLIALLTIAIVIISFIFSYNLYINEASKYDHNLTTSITSIIALTIGSAAAIGSAVATLKVASLGLKISEQQERRDKLQFFDDRTNNSIDIFSNIAISLNDLYSTVSFVYSQVLLIVFDLMTQQKQNLNAEIITNELYNKFELERKLLNKQLMILSENLKALQKDDFALKCFEESVQRNKQVLPILYKKAHEKYPDYEWGDMYKMDITMLSVVKSFINKAFFKSKDDFYKTITLTYLRFLSSQESDSELFHKTSVLRFLGNSLLTVYPNRKENVVVTLNYGAFVFVDLINVLPDGKIIDDVLSKNYSDFFKDTSFSTTFNVDRILPKTMIDEALELREKPELLITKTIYDYI